MTIIISIVVVPGIVVVVVVVVVVVLSAVCNLGTRGIRHGERMGLTGRWERRGVYIYIYIYI